MADIPSGPQEFRRYRPASRRKSGFRRSTPISSQAGKRSTSACRTRPGITVDGKHYGVPYQWGPNVLMYNTDVFKEAPEELERRFRGADLPDGKSNKGRIQAYDGAIYIADAALLSDVRRSRNSASRTPTSSMKTQYKAALDLLRPAARADPALLARCQRSRSTTSRMKASSLRVRGRSRSICCRRQEADRLDRSGGRRHRLGRHHHAGGRRGPSELRLYVAGAFAGNRRCRAMSLPGSARSRSCPLPARATNCSATKAARPTATRISPRSSSGRRRFPNAPPREPCVPYYRWVTDYIAVIGGR